MMKVQPYSVVDLESYLSNTGITAIATGAVVAYICGPARSAEAANGR